MEKDRNNKQQQIVIIGGVACGMKAASRIKRRIPHAHVLVLEKGDYISYAACGFPFFLSGMVKDYSELLQTPAGVMRDSTFFKNVKGVEVRTQTETIKIDRAKKTVRALHTKTGQVGDIAYDKLVLATGGLPFVLPVEGKDLRGIATLASVEDAVEIMKNLSAKNVNHAVVVGAGLIGIEVTEALIEQGVRVTIVEMLDQVLPALLDREIALMLSRYAAEKGVRILTATKVTAFQGNSSGRVTKVITDTGEIDTDMVIVAVGTRPNVRLAKDAGLEIGSTGAIAVNEHLQTSDPDIYAGGDCVENTHLITGKKVFAPMGSTANKHGRVIADCIAGDAAVFPGVLSTAIFKFFDYSTGRTGLSEKEAEKSGYDVETVLVSGPDRPHFYMGAKPIVIKLIAEKESGRLLGAQMIGLGDVAKRLDIVVGALNFGSTVQQLSTLDLAYAPPFSPAVDNILTAAHVMTNKLSGRASSYSPLQVKEKLDRGDDFIFLDVRTPKEFEQVRIDYPNVQLLPLGRLRSDAEILPRDKEIVIFCKTSLRAYEAQLILTERGFQRVRFMDGGILAWPFKLSRN